MLDSTQLDLESTGLNFHLPGIRGLGKTWQARAAANVAAIKLAKRIGDRPATEDEKRTLIQFIGFGATELSALFPRAGQGFRPGYEAIGKSLHDLVTGEERAALARATQYAHYTPEWIVRAFWKGLKRLGFNGGAVLEPGMGSGLFLAMMPKQIAERSTFLGVENDPTTVRIARLLYPQADILQADFTTADLPSDFDLAVGNPPFAKHVVHGKGGIPTMTLHNHFIARAIERLRPGGLAAFVVSRYTMDQADRTARDYISGMADLLAAIRLPEGSMAKEAGTHVVVDLLFFRKREADEPSNGIAWTDTVESGLVIEGKPVSINEYYAANPNMALGTHAVASSQFGPDYTLKPSGSNDLDIRLLMALKVLPENVYSEAEIGAAGADKKRVTAPNVLIGTAAEGALIKEGSFFVASADNAERIVELYDAADRASGAERKALLVEAAKEKQANLSDHQLWQVVGRRPELVKVKDGRGGEGIFPKHAQIIRGLIDVRDAVRAVLRCQQNDVPCAAEQAQLNRAYDSFVAQHGPINKTIIQERPATDRKTKMPVLDEEGRQKIIEVVTYPNLRHFHDDPDCWLVASIEHYDQATQRAVKRPIFTKRVVSAPLSIDVNTPTDALFVTLNETGRVDIPRISELLGVREEQAIESLKDAIYRNPTTGNWEMADEYLSGPVRTKLMQAQVAAENDPQYERNVAALDAVQPVDLNESEIYLRLGMPIVNPKDVQDFINDVMGIQTTVSFAAEVNSWSVNQYPFRGRSVSVTEWGTPRRDAGELMLDALNQSSPRIFDQIEDPGTGRKKSVYNAKETQAAQDKLDAINSAFRDWVWKGAARTERLVADYNRVFNNLVPRNFDGSHLVLPGASPVVTLRKHQKRAVWRQIIGNTYLAHVVGSGKTYSVIAGIYEQRRLGLIKKPLIIVPGHTLAQWSQEFMTLYPQARILVADEENFDKENRARFIARATTGDWDAIILTHSAFSFLSIPADFEKGMIRDRLARYEELLDGLDVHNDKQTRKKIEAAKERLERKLLDLARLPKDDMVHIGEIGIDHIAVDEAQVFRKLSFETDQQLKGIDGEGSKRSWHLYVATRYIAEKYGSKRFITMASGTPIVNTMGEMYSLIRFMDEGSLDDHRVSHFDAWASTFGQVKRELELQTSGEYKPVDRFSEFLNIPDLSRMVRKFADFVMQEDLRGDVKLPAIKGGERTVLTYPGSRAFKSYQKLLGARIKAMEGRGRPLPGDDIILTVIGDGRHAAIDMRLTDPEKDKQIAGLDEDFVNDLPYLDECYENDPGNKLNGLIDNVFEIWKATSDKVYLDPITEVADPLPGASQMIFSDLGVSDKRGFHVYAWIRSQLESLGVPPGQIAFMQDYKKPSAKQRLFNDMNNGRKRILIGSSEAMGTGVNAQRRLIALHHLDVPWMPAWIGQREGRIERQGNLNDVIEIYAYATLGSMDATMWQMNERKQRFIEAALKGDESIRRMEDVESDVASFAMAKAMASGDTRLMRKAGLEDEIAKLRRRRVAFYDSQRNVKKNVAAAREEIQQARAQVEQLRLDLNQSRLPSSDYFELTIGETVYHDRERAKEALKTELNTALNEHRTGVWTMFKYGGFEFEADGYERPKLDLIPEHRLTIHMRRNGQSRFTPVFDNDAKTIEAILNRIDRLMLGLYEDLQKNLKREPAALAQIADFEARINGIFDMQPVLDQKEAELRELEAELESSAAANDDVVITEVAA